MEERFRRTAKRKVSHFILGEEGRVGSRSAFTAAAVVSVASLAAMLLGTPQNAYAGNCGQSNCPPGYWCCLGALGDYSCSPQPKVNCWQV